MSEPPLEDHSGLQLRFWKFQRLTWIGFAAVLLAAVLGLTGSGGLWARAESDLATGLIEYSRVGRWSTGDELRVVFLPGPRADRTLRVSPAFASHYQLEDVQPPPARSVATGQGSRLHFEVEPGQRAEVTVHIRSLKPGLATYDVAIDDARTGVRTLILP